MACRRLSSAPYLQIGGVTIRLLTVTPGSHVVSAKRNGMQVRRSSRIRRQGWPATEHWPALFPNGEGGDGKRTLSLTGDELKTVTVSTRYSTATPTATTFVWTRAK